MGTLGPPASYAPVEVANSKFNENFHFHLVTYRKACSTLYPVKFMLRECIWMVTLNRTSSKDLKFTSNKKKSCIWHHTIMADLCYENNDEKKVWTYVGLSPTTTKIKTMSVDACCKAASTTGSAKEQKYSYCNITIIFATSHSKHERPMRILNVQIIVDNEVFVTEIVWLLLYVEYVTFWAQRAMTGSIFAFTG